MRTYSRKPLKLDKLENATDLCRLCLEKPNESVPIYTDENNLYSSLALRIMICVGLEMTKDEYLSNIICSQCHKEIERYYSFRKKCEKSHLKLKSHLQSLKAEQLEASQNHNTVFTISSNGSISMRDGSNHLEENDQPIIMLTKILSDQSKVPNCPDLQMCNDAATENNNVVPEVPQQSIDNVPAQPNPETDEYVTLIPVSAREDILSEEKTETAAEPDISEFLFNMLTQLGIITQHEGGTVELGPKNSSALELETAEGNNVVFELVEEDEEMEQNPEVSAADESTNSKKKVKLVTLSKVRSRSVSCEVCGKQLTSHSVLARHMRNVHQREKLHACPKCGKRFAQKEVMRRHYLLHQEKRPFSCSLCPKSFTQRAALLAHARSHLSERPLTLHPCPTCYKLFLYASGLSRHLQLHRNIRFPCEGCGRRFSDKSSLRRHQRNKRNCTNDDHHS